MPWTTSETFSDATARLSETNDRQTSPVSSTGRLARRTTGEASRRRRTVSATTQPMMIAPIAALAVSNTLADARGMDDGEQVVGHVVADVLRADVQQHTELVDDQHVDEPGDQQPARGARRDHAVGEHEHQPGHEDEVQRPDGPPDREDERRVGLREADRGPGEARRDHQQADAVVRAPRPRVQPGGDEGDADQRAEGRVDARAARRDGSSRWPPRRRPPARSRRSRRARGAARRLTSPAPPAARRPRARPWR